MMKLVWTGAVFLTLSAGASFAASPVACGTQFGTPAPTGIQSDTFDANDRGRDNQDAYGAADFRVQTQCTLDEVDVEGRYVVYHGPAWSVDVVFYRNVPNANIPGQAIKAYTQLHFTDPDGTGNFAIPIPRTTLTPGVYWVSVSAHIDYDGNGMWIWNQQTQQLGYPDKWRENGDWYSGCTCWGNPGYCLGAPGDFMFVLRGSGQ